MPEPTSPLNIFIIYARADADALTEFKKSLTPLVRRGEVAIWYDAEIIPGQEWEKAIEKNLKAADIIVLFLSSDFFNSDYIQNKELPEALKRHENGEVVVAPIVVRHCQWREYPQIGRLQVLPDNAQPVLSKKHWDGPDDAFTTVANGILRMVREMIKKRQEGKIELSRQKEEIPHDNDIATALKKAAEEYDKGNFETAFSIFDQYKENSLFLAKYQSRLGRMYLKGQFISIDYQQAKMWYEKAIEKEDADGMTGLGTLYYYGHGVVRDYQEARYWFEKAAEKGNATAMSNLGLLYKLGKGIKKDYKQAKFWFEQAAKKGNALAMNQLGVLYHNGEGVTQNYQKAIIWYERAAEKGNVGAMDNLGLIYEHGLGVPKDIRTSKYWYEKAMDHENE